MEGPHALTFAETTRPTFTQRKGSPVPMLMLLDVWDCVSPFKALLYLNMEVDRGHNSDVVLYVQYYSGCLYHGKIGY